MKVDYVDFKSRKARSCYIAERFGTYISGRVLDVGQLVPYKLALLEELATEKPRLPISRLYRRLFYPRQENYLNRYAHTFWAVLEKAPAEQGKAP